MSTKTKKKAKTASKGKRYTAAQLLRVAFEAKKVGTNSSLVKMVKEKTGSKKFDDKQLAWYKSAFRHGKLAGQKAGRNYSIAQAPKKKAKEEIDD